MFYVILSVNINIVNYEYFTVYMIGDFFRYNNGGISTVINIACFPFLSGCVYAGCVLP
jgi:hypothetical protein